MARAAKSPTKKKRIAAPPKLGAASNAAVARDLAAAVTRIEALERDLKALRNAAKGALLWASRFGPMFQQDAGGNVTFTAPTGLAVTAVTIQIGASASLQLTASLMQVEAGSVLFNTPMLQSAGVFRCDTVQATTVIAASYTPGAGNVW